MVCLVLWNNKLVLHEANLDSNSLRRIFLLSYSNSTYLDQTWNSPTHSCTWISSIGFSIFHNFETRKAIALKRGTLSLFTILYIPIEYFDLTVWDFWETSIWQSHTWDSSTRTCWWIRGQVPHNVGPGQEFTNTFLYLNLNYGIFNTS